METSNAHECVTKVCSKCRKEKSLDEFHKHSKKPDGRCLWCKQCRVEWRHDHYLAVRESEKRSREKNAHKYAEREKQYQLAYAKANSERKVAMAREWRQKNIYRFKCWRDGYRERERYASKERYWNNPEHFRLLARNRLKKQVDELADSYVKRRLRINNPPSDLVNIKRQQLKINRATKQLKKAIQERKEECNSN